MLFQWLMCFHCCAESWNIACYQGTWSGQIQLPVKHAGWGVSGLGGCALDLACLAAFCLGLVISFVFTKEKENKKPPVLKEDPIAFCLTKVFGCASFLAEAVGSNHDQQLWWLTVINLQVRMGELGQKEWCRQGWRKALGMESKTRIVLPLHLDLLSLLVCYFGDGCKPSLGASTRLHNCDCKSTVLPWEQGSLYQPWKLSPSIVGFVQLEGAYRKAQVEADLP